MNFKLEILGTPVPKGRPRWSKHGTYTPKKTKDYESYIRQCWVGAYGNLMPSEKPLAVEIIFYMPIPKSATKRAKEFMIAGQIRHTKKPDLDNMTKIIFDGLNKFAYEDDSQIVSLFTKKEYAKTPKTLVWIREVE